MSEEDGRPPLPCPMCGRRNTGGDWMDKRTRLIVAMFGLASMAVTMDGTPMDDQTYVNEVVRRFRAGAKVMEIMEPGLHNTGKEHAHSPEEPCYPDCPANWEP